MKVLFSRSAQKDLIAIFEHISDYGFPETAYDYVNRIMNTIVSKVDLKMVLKPCRTLTWRKRGYECYVFENNYIVAFRRKEKTVEVMRIIHGSRIK